MRGLQSLGGVLAVIASIWLLRIVLHAYTDHGHVDVFHLVVGIGSAVVGVILVRRSLVRRA